MSELARVQSVQNHQAQMAQHYEAALAANDSLVAATHFALADEQLRAMHENALRLNLPPDVSAHLMDRFAQTAEGMRSDCELLKSSMETPPAILDHAFDLDWWHDGVQWHSSRIESAAVTPTPERPVLADLDVERHVRRPETGQLTPDVKRALAEVNESSVRLSELMRQRADTEIARMSDDPLASYVSAEMEREQTQPGSSPSL